MGFVISSRAEAVAEMQLCARSFPYFLKYVRIRDANKGIVPFEVWPHSTQVAEDWQSGKSWLEGKARQLGFSWELAAFNDWLLLFREQARILSISLGQRESIELLEKVKFVHGQLPSWLRLAPNLSNQETFGIGATGSVMMALPSTEQGGRSFQASIVQFDEFAFHPYAGANYVAARSAVADGGQMLIVSTGNGPNGMFHEMWNDPDLPFRKRFTGWRSRPDRDNDWYDREYRAYLSQGKAMFFRRENPETVEEMFTAFVGLVYESFSDEKNVRPAPWRWEDSKYRVAGIDPGQGDPFAIIPIGEHADGRSHQFGEFYERGTVDYQTAVEYLMEWHRRAKFHGIFVDGAEGTFIATLRSRGLPAYAANKERGTGIALVQSHLESGIHTVEPDCVNTIREYKSYRWAEHRSPGEADPYTTSTPIDHHADAMDGTRYGKMGLSLSFSKTPQAGQPDVGLKVIKRPPKPNEDALAQKLSRGQSITKPTRSGPDYRTRTVRVGR